MWTKGQIVSDAFGELALQGFEFDITPDETQLALRRMDMMMATWEARGVRIGYAFPASPGDVDPNTESGLPDSAVEAVTLNLAVRLAPGFGKQVSRETRTTATSALQVLLVDSAMPQRQQMPDTLPRGAGNRRCYGVGPFFPPRSTDSLPVDAAGDMNILPE